MPLHLAKALLILPLLLICASCAMRPSELPRGHDELLVVKSVNIPTQDAYLLSWAKHTFIDYKKAGTWKRLEIPSMDHGVERLGIRDDDAFADTRAGSDVRVLAVLTGEPAELAIEEMLALEQGYPYRERGDYWMWPGPNSNTFIAWLIRNSYYLDAELDHNAIGADFAWFRLGATPAGYGFALDTPVIGASLGLREGIELHVLQLEFGMSLFPPAIKLPFIGRIGWDSRALWEASHEDAPASEASPASAPEPLEP